MSGYTKGPWTALFGEKIHVQDRNKNTLAIATHIHMYGRRDTSEVEANARLMSAAPELLDALEILLDDHRRIDPHHEHLCPLCVAASVAIDKAWGKS